MSLVGFRARNHPQQAPKPHVDDRALPSEDFQTLQRRFRFSLDAAASPQNAKLPRFFSAENCGLTNGWRGERVYCNPPYSSIRPWVEKAWAECSTAELIVLLLPANRTEQAWWQELIEPLRDRQGSPLRTEFMRGRLRFLHPEADQIRPNERPPFGCLLCIWSGPVSEVEA